MTATAQKQIDDILQEAEKLLGQAKKAAEDIKASKENSDFSAYFPVEFPTSSGEGKARADFNIRDYIDFQEKQKKQFRFTVYFEVKIPQQYHAKQPVFRIRNTLVVYSYNPENPIPWHEPLIERNMDVQSSPFAWNEIKIRPHYFQKWWADCLQDEVKMFGPAAFIKFINSGKKLEEKILRQKEYLEQINHENKIHRIIFGLKTVVY